MSDLVDQSIALLLRCGIEVEAGMTEEQLATTEQTYGFRFNPDHREFLSKATPIGENWVHWRDDPEEQLRSGLNWPIEGVLFDVEKNSFWPPSWGTRPRDIESALAHAEQEIRLWPTLIPVWGHRFMAAAPQPTPAPVFSVWQTDVIVYGNTLFEYFNQEFGIRDDRYHERSQFDPESAPPWSYFAMNIDVE